MRSLRPFAALAIGAVLTTAAACAQSADQEAAASEVAASETVAAEGAPQELACYLARGTMEEATP